MDSFLIYQVIVLTRQDAMNPTSWQGFPPGVSVQTRTCVWGTSWVSSTAVTDTAGSKPHSCCVHTGQAATLGCQPCSEEGSSSSHPRSTSVSWRCLVPRPGSGWQVRGVKAPGACLPGERANAIIGWLFYPKFSAKDLCHDLKFYSPRPIPHLCFPRSH